MSGQRVQQKVQDLLALADVTIGGDHPWDIQVHNGNLYQRVLADGSLGLGEAYMDGWWDSAALDGFFSKVLSAGLDMKVRTRTWFFDALRARVFNLQKVSRAFDVGRRHYDIGNDLYQCMLDKRMIYSCGYWKNAATLDEAQEAKLDLVCRKLALKPGMRILDIGCGWGGMARFAAERYQVKVVGITVSKEQAAFAKDFCQGFSIEIRLQDYRSLEGTFDRIVSIGMIEHVGRKNYRAFMKIAGKCLKEGGLFLLQTIGGNQSVLRTDPWIERYIFPNSMLPSLKQLAAAAEGLFVLEDLHNFGADYDKTLMRWYKNFCDSWKTLKKDYDERFYRMWTYYLLCSAGSFRARVNQLWQFVFSPGGIPGGYAVPR